MKGITLEKATVKDLHKINELMYKQAEEERKFMNNLNKKEKYTFHSKEEIKRMLSSKKCYIILAKVGENIVGCGSVSIEKMSHWSKYKKQGYMGMLYIDKKYRRKGLAKNLQDARIKWLKLRGIKLISNKVLSKNIPALKLAQKRGFKPHIISMYKELK